MMKKINKLNKDFALWIFASEISFLSLKVGQSFESNFWPESPFTIGNAAIFICSFYFGAKSYEKVIMGNIPLKRQMS